MRTRARVSTDVRQNEEHPWSAERGKYVGYTCVSEKLCESFNPHEANMPEPFVPDLSSRPFSMTVERQMTAPADLIYDAWTRRFDMWLPSQASYS